jgi:hypothetical protein
MAHVRQPRPHTLYEFLPKGRASQPDDAVQPPSSQLPGDDATEPPD